jgi:hypothetical protein
MLYKFLDTRDIEKVIGGGTGTLIVSSLEYFRELEETWGDIADPLEGSTELTVKGEFIVRENSPELSMINNTNIGFGTFQQFAKVSGGGMINMSGVRFIHKVTNLYIYSVAIGEIEALKTEMCVNSKRVYDACLRVGDLEQLRFHIFQTGRVRELGCMVADAFQPGLIQAVEYEPRSRDVRDGPAIEPSPFKKDDRFKCQSEVRLLLVPTSEHSEKRLTIEIADPAKFFREEFRDFRR